MEIEDCLFGSGDGYCDQEALLPIANSSNRWMTLSEERALSLSKFDLEKGIDPVFVSMALHKERFLPEAVYRIVMCMLQKGYDRRRICEYLLNQIPSFVSLQNFVTVLDKCGYRSLSALLLFNSFKWNSPYVSEPKTAGSSPRAYSLYSNLKRLVNNAQLNKPGLFLRKMADKCYSKMISETNIRQKQRLADNCVAIICAETDIIAITFDKTLCRHVLFTQLKRLSRETSNTLVSDLCRYGRLANAYAIAGDYNMCEQMLDEAICKAYIAGPCIEFLHLVYIIAYVMLWNFENSPTIELRSKLLMWCRVGLKCVEEDFVDNKNKWRRIIMLRMILSLLGLGNRATVIKHCPVDESSIAEATLIFAEFDKYWEGIETRREMYYYVAKARLCDLEKNQLAALDYLKLAYKLAIKGQFEEKKFIRAYYKNIFITIGRTRHALCAQMYTSSKLSQTTVPHNCVDEFAGKQTHVNKVLKNQKSENSIRQTKTKCLETRTRPQPIGSSCPLQNMVPGNQGRNMVLQAISHNQERHLFEAEIEFCMPSLERPPLSGDSNPDIFKD